MILPFPAGGSTDVAGRMMVNAMAKIFGQNMVVDNVAGASGTIGMTKLLRAAPDGYTTGVGTIGTHVIVPAISTKPPYDPVAQFDPVGLIGSAPVTLIAKNGLPVKNLSEFSNYLRANPGKVSYGSAGVGSMSHYGCVMLLSSLKQDALHVPYRGSAPALADLMGGQIDFVCDQPTGALPAIQTGKVKGIAVLGSEKLPQMLSLPTAASQGFKDTNVRVWTGLFAPKGTPPEIIKRLNDAMVQAARTPELKSQAQTSGLDLPNTYLGSPGALSAMIILGGKRDGAAMQARKEYLD